MGPATSEWQQKLFRKFRYYVYSFIIPFKQTNKHQNRRNYWFSLSICPGDRELWNNLILFYRITGMKEGNIAIGLLTHWQLRSVLTLFKFEKSQLWWCIIRIFFSEKVSIYSSTCFYYLFLCPGSQVNFSTESDASVRKLDSCFANADFQILNSAWVQKFPLWTPTIVYEILIQSIVHYY